MLKTRETGPDMLLSPTAAAHGEPTSETANRDPGEGEGVPIACGIAPPGRALGTPQTDHALEALVGLEVGCVGAHAAMHGFGDI